MKATNPALRQTLSLIVAAALLLCLQRPVAACGPFSLEAVFTFAIHPDVPLEKFARGEVGVLQPSYARSYLFAAYRHLSGVGFNADEQKVLAGFWKERLDYEWKGDDEGWIGQWNDARKQVEGVAEPSKIVVYRSRPKPNEYEQYLNCQKDAFRNAVATLNERVKEYGAGAEAMKEWVRAQDEVFANCSEGEHIPDPLPAGAEATLRADRAYQRAAALFYAERLGEAEQAFKEIASDNASTWRKAAPYLVARALIRKASLGPEAEKNASLSNAERQLDQILADKGLSETHADSRKLRNLVRLRLHPEERTRELARSLSGGNTQASLYQDLWDYTTLLDRFTNEESAEETHLDQIPSSVREDDATDWIITFQIDEPEATRHALERWEGTKSLPWLVAAASKVGGKDPRAASLLDAAGRVPASSPAFAALSYHTARLLTEAGRRGEARAKLDALLARQRTQFPPSALNLVLALRTKLARNLDEFLRFAQRRPAAFSWDEDGREIPADSSELTEDENLSAFAKGRTLFDADATRVLNEVMPLSMLKEAATNPNLPDHLRREVALAAWVRSFLLNDREAGRELAPIVETLAPEMKGLLSDEQRSPTAEARKFSALYAVLKSPGAEPFVDFGIGRTTPLREIDNYRDNWWCVFDMEAQAAQTSDDSEEEGSAKTKIKAAPPDFITPAQRVTAVQQRMKLRALGTAPNFLARMAVEWAQRFPDDPRVPEALHLAVKATRYGCTDKQTGALSKAAFDILHKKYPNNPWTKKTPFWFKDI